MRWSQMTSPRGTDGGKLKKKLTFVDVPKGGGQENFKLFTIVHVGAKLGGLDLLNLYPDGYLNS